MLLPAVEVTVVDEEGGIVVEEEGEAASKSSIWSKRLSLLWDKSFQIVKAIVVRAWRVREHVKYLVLHYLHLERSYDLLILCREHSTRRTCQVPCTPLLTFRAFL